jgi:hypothetical protein
VTLVLQCVSDCRCRSTIFFELPFFPDEMLSVQRSGVSLTYEGELQRINSIPEMAATDPSISRNQSLSMEEVGSMRQSFTSSFTSRTRRVSIDDIPGATSVPMQYPEPPPRLLAESPAWFAARGRVIAAVSCINEIPNTYVPASPAHRVHVAKYRGTGALGAGG